MSAASAFGAAVWIGLAIAAPVGPIGLLVIQRTVAHGRAVGLATGLGAAVADAVYGAIGAFGVAALIQALQAARVPLAVGGGAFLLWMALRTWRDAGHSPERLRPAAHAGTAPRLGAAFVGTFGLTLTNPATILSFIAIFGSMAASEAAAEPAWMVAGVLVGSALWWLMLSGALGALRQRFDERARRWVSRVSALALAGFALWQWGDLLRG